MGWIETTVAALLGVALLTIWTSRGATWLEPRLWRNAAVISSLVMSGILVYLTIDSLNQIREGSARVPAYTAINHEIRYAYNPERLRYTPQLGRETGFFGRVWSEEEARALVNQGKLTFQGRNCMECHTLLGNGAYYAPDLTRAWLDPKWDQVIRPMVGAQTREEAMLRWLQHPNQYPTGPRRMPDLGLTEEEARALVAFLKWMSGIDTNGFPDRFAAQGR